MEEYSRLTKAPDIIPISMFRVASPIVRSWVKSAGFEMIKQLDMSKAELDLAMKSGSSLGTMLQDRREIRFVFPSTFNSEISKRNLLAIVADTIAAHEIGDVTYPFGHYETLLNPESALTPSLVCQGNLDLTTVSLAESGFTHNSLKMACHRSIAEFASFHFNDSWPIEMLATFLSQRRRLEVHLTSQAWEDPVRKLLESYAKREVEKLHLGLDVYSVGHAFWHKLVEKFGSHAEQIIRSIVFDNYVIGASLRAIRHKEHEHFLNISTILLCLLHPNCNTGRAEEIIPILEENKIIRNPSLLTKKEALKKSIESSSNIVTRENMPILIGDLRTALNNIICITCLDKQKGFREIWFKSCLKKQIRTDSLKLAIKIFELRNKIFSSIFIHIDKQDFQDKLWQTLRYIRNEISYEEFLRLQSPIKVYFDYDIESEMNEYQRLPWELKQYYLNNKESVERCVRSPHEYFDRFF